MRECVSVSEYKVPVYGLAYYNKIYHIRIRAFRHAELLYYFILSNDLGVGTVGSFQRTVDPAAPAADDADSRFGLLFPLYNTYQLYKLEDETHPPASMCDSAAGG